MTHILKDNVREGSTSTGTGNFVTNGGIGPVSTGVIGQAFADVCSVGDLFEYVIHNRTQNEWEVGRGHYSAANTISRDTVISSSNSNGLVNFSAGDKAVWIAPTSIIHQYFANLVNIEQFGAIAGDDNTGPIAAARTYINNLGLSSNVPIIAPGVTIAPWGVKTIMSLDFAADTKGEGTALSFSQGTESAPATTSSPILYIEKITQGDSGDINDHGGIDVRVEKVAGTNNTYGIFSAARDAGGSGIVTPFFSIVKVDNVNATYSVANKIYIEKTVVTPNAILIGIDMGLIDSSGQDNGWQETYALGSTIGYSLSASPGRGTFGFYTAGSGSGNGLYTGMLFDTDSIMPDSFSGKSEALRIKGGSISAHKYTGIWLESGYLTTGINLVGPTYSSNVAVLMPTDTRVAFGTSIATANYFIYNSAISTFDMYGSGFSVAGTKVVGVRDTGWTAMTGTGTKGGSATSSVTLPQLAQIVKQLIDTLETHGLIGT